jgi:hypothetical protein
MEAEMAKRLRGAARKAHAAAAKRGGPKLKRKPAWLKKKLGHVR